MMTKLLWIQGLYFLATGLWPLLDIQSFQGVTGPKTDHVVTGSEADHWLVMTVGVLVTAIGITLLYGGWRGRQPVELAVLAIFSSLGLTGIDVVYVTRKVIDPIYLADAVAEVGLIVLWGVALSLRDPRPMPQEVEPDGQLVPLGSEAV
jgi:hypothetical protein